VQERAEWARSQVTRFVAAARRVDHLPRVAVSAVAALALLTTFTAAAPDLGSEITAAAPGELDLDTGTTREVALSPEVDGVLATDLTDGTDGSPDIPEIGTDRELTPFERSPVGDLADGAVVPADLIVRTEDAPVDTAGLAEPLAGARHAAAAAGLTANATAPDGDDREVSVLGVDGATFRPLTPEVTAGADAVWERFADGDALVSHELAALLDLELGGTLVLASDVATLPVRIGAFAANGAPPLADILVPVDVAALLGVDDPNTLIVAAGKGDPQALADALSEATGGEIELRSAPVVDQGDASGRAQLPARRSASGRIEPFTYTSRADGRISIHGDWIARNITRVQLPGMPGTQCHKAMVPQLQAVVNELIERDLYSHLDPSQFAGCFVARHIDWNPTKPLSMHAWGLAIDFNTQDNWLGAEPKMDRRVVEVFERWGFDWGGHWRRPDGMHFELARIVPVP
jgi:hypothetical protein